MESSMPKVRVGFYLVGDYFDINEVTDKLNIQPTSTRTKDDWPVPMMAKTSWELETKKDYCKAVCWQFEKIMEDLVGKEAKINELCAGLDLEAIFTIVINMENGDGPEMVLTKEIVKFIGLINAEVGFDIYVD